MIEVWAERGNEKCLAKTFETEATAKMYIVCLHLWAEENGHKNIRLIMKKG